MLEPVAFFSKRVSSRFFVIIATVILVSVCAQPSPGQTGSVPSRKPAAAFAGSTAGEAKPPITGPAVEQPSAAEEMPLSLSSSQKWVGRYQQLAFGLRKRTLTAKDADDFYLELDVALRGAREKLHTFLSGSDTSQARAPEAESPKSPSDSPVETGEVKKKPAKIRPPTDRPEGSGSRNFQVVKQLSTDLVVLYKLRIALLPALSPTLRQTVTGTGIEGVQAFKDEIDYLLLMLRIRLRLLPAEGGQSFRSIKKAPIPVLLALLQLFVACFIFYLWRRWAKKGIPNLRASILGIKPRRVTHTWSAKLLWYLNRVRSPLEWWFLLSVSLNIVRTAKGHIINDLVWTNAQLVLVAWFLVLLVDALSTRGAAGLRSETAKLRLRSFWLIAAWGLVVGLGLGITGVLAGEGTIYAWVWVLAKLLAIPVAFLLIRWWRPEIYRSLEEIQQPTTFVQKICQNQKGLPGFLGAALGAVYLFVIWMRRFVLRLVTTFEGGRYLIANLTRLEAIRVSEREPQKIEGDPVSEDIRRLLFDDDGGTVESVGQDTLEKMTRLVEKGRKGMAAVVVEHGGGKSFLIRRLADRFGEGVLRFSCPPGGFSAFEETFARKLGLNSSDATPDAISRSIQEKSIRIIAVDDIHRLSRPAFYGQKDMDRMAAVYRAVTAEAFWFLTLDWAAWQYISRVRDSQLFIDSVIKMPLWSEGQIRELVDLRTAYAGIEPDFGELALPRQFEDDEHKTMEDRNRFGFFRILWNASDGNPVASLNLWADSLRVDRDGKFRVTLPQLPDAGDLDEVDMSVLLTLRVIAQSGMASKTEIVDSLRLPEMEVDGALHLAYNHRWIEQEGGHYRLSWRWFRSIMRTLSRQNLLVRKI